MTTTAEILGRRIERLQKKLANAKADASRYRWLKKEMRCEYGWPNYEYRHWCGIHSDNQNLDRTIDNKIKEEKENGNDKEGLRVSGESNQSTKRATTL